MCSVKYNISRVNRVQIKLPLPEKKKKLEDVGLHFLPFYRVVPFFPFYYYLYTRAPFFPHLFSCALLLLLVEYGGVAASVAPIHLALSGMQALKFALLEGFRLHGNRQRHVHPNNPKRCGRRKKEIKSILEWRKIEEEKNSRCAHGYRQNSLKSDVHVSLNVTDKIHAYRAPNKSERFFARRRQNVYRSEMIIASLFAIASNRKCQRQKVLFHLCLISDLSRASSIATSDFRGNLPMCLCMISFEIFNSQTPSELRLWVEIWSYNRNQLMRFFGRIHIKYSCWLYVSFHQTFR